MKSQQSSRAKVSIYRGFSGLNSSASDIASENPDAQAFISIDNLFCSTSGYLTNERPLQKVGVESGHVTHVRRLSAAPNSVVYALKKAGATELKSTDSQTPGVLWPPSSTVSSAVFNRKVVVVCADQDPAVFDGAAWSELPSPESSGASIVAAVARRLVLTGFASNPTEVIVSRVDNETVMPSDELPSENAVTKAFRFNVRNHIGTADAITGLAAFESTRLAVFTNDRVLIWNADADYSKWEIDTRANINVGCVSNNTIRPVGEDLFFCSRAGIHSIRRSALNGATVFTQPMSKDVEETYRTLMSLVADPSQVSACYDRDNGRYTVFFPTGGINAVRLSIDISPRAEEQSSISGLWSLSSHAGLSCGDSLAGSTIFGSPSGLLSLGREFDSGTGKRGAGSAETPILWHGDMTALKKSTAISLYASGRGVVVVDAFDEAGRQLTSTRFVLEQKNGITTGSPPLVSQFERPFQHSYVGLRLRITIQDGADRARIFAFGVRLGEI